MGYIVLFAQALIAIPKIGQQIEDGIRVLVSWYIANQNAETGAKLMDALAFGLKAQTKEDRLEAAKRWQDALSRPRFD